MTALRVRLALGLCALIIGSGLLAFHAPVATAQQATSPATTQPVSMGNQLHVGESINSTLTDADVPDHYAVFGAYGDLISVGLFPAQDSKLLPALEMYAPDGSLAASAEGTTGALISAFRLPSTGAYIIYAKTTQPKALGAYTLSVGSGWILRDLDGNPLRLGSPYSGALLRLGDRQVWRLDLRAGAAFSVAVQPSANSPLDPVIEVLTPNGDQLAVAHDLSNANSAATGLLSAPTTGTYLVRISGYINKSIGAYDLIVRAPSATPTPVLNITAEPLDQKIEASVGQGSQYSQVFRGIPGQTVTIEIHAKQPGQFDPILEVYGPSGRRIAEADDISPDNSDARLNVMLDDGVGVYTVRVSGYALLPGEFTLIMHSP